MSGKLSSVEWQLAEARRAANRLHDRWKKEPWAPGRTIDLGPHEPCFIDECCKGAVSVSALPASVQDWLRWRFRRLRLDRRDEGGWLRVLRRDLPERLKRIPARPLEAAACDLSGETSLSPCTSEASVPSARSKRHQPDKPKFAPKPRARKQMFRGRPRKATSLADADAQELALLQFRHRDLLAPLTERCTTEADRHNLLIALQAYARSPDDAGAGAKWRSMVRALQ